MDIRFFVEKVESDIMFIFKHRNACTKQHDILRLLESTVSTTGTFMKAKPVKIGVNKIK